MKISRIISFLSFLALFVIVGGIIFGDLPAMYLLYWFIIGFIGVGLAGRYLNKEGM